MNPELLFSYGTLQLESIQRANFGRTLSGVPDSLPGFVAAPIPIGNPLVAEALGQTHYSIARYTGSPNDAISGTVYELTHNELQRADDYELPEYKRVEVVLASGTQCWVYADAEHLPPQR